MPTLLKCSGTIEELIQHNDIIFGCTGTDILKQVNLEHVFNGDKIFVSCSSEDKEFLSLLKWIQRDERFTFSANPLLDISYITTKSHKIRILRGGFPINFDNNIEIEPEKDIQLTRTLLLGAIFQALICVKERRFGKYVRYTLHPEIQRYIALKWLTLTHPKNFSQFLEQFSSVEWIICNSQGENFYSPMLKEIFLSEEGRIIAI